MLSKNNINFINLIIFLTIILNFNCQEDTNTHYVKAIKRNQTLYNIQKKYKINLEKEKLIFSLKKGNSISSGEYFTFETQKAIPIKSIKLYNLPINNENNLLFKLYVNNKYKGKYKSNDSIVLNSNIFSLRILFLTKNKENTYNAWDKNFKYIIIRTNNIKANRKVKIELSLLNKNKFNKITTLSRNKNKFYKQKSKLQYNFPQKTNSINIALNKKSQLITETSFLFNSNGNFHIHQLVANKKTKIIYKDFFYEGNWNIKKSNSKNIIELSGYVSGYFKEKINKYLNHDYYNCEAVIENNKFSSSGLLNSFQLDFPNASFVNIKELAKNIIVQTPYSTNNNFTGVKLYPCNKCFLRYEVAKDLLKANQDFNKLNYKIKAFDCYRPFHVQAIMFKKFPVKGYVADSIGGSVHNRASAIDLSITDMQGNEIDMGTNFDDLSYKSNHSYKYFSDTILNNRLLLKRIMMKNNFTPINSEWWHYNHINGRLYKKSDLDFPCQ